MTDGPHGLKPLPDGCLGRVLDPAGIPIGTCFQIANGWLVTAYHVVEHAGAAQRDATVSIDPLIGGEQCIATVARVHEAHDLALLHAPRSTLQSSLPRAIDGRPVSPRTPVVTRGVAAIDDPGHEYRYLPATGIWHGFAERDGVRLGRIDARGVARGMSGAPVCTLDGRLVGVVSGRYNSTDGWHEGTVWVALTTVLADDLAELADLEVTDHTRRWRPHRRTLLLAGIGTAAAITVPVALELFPSRPAPLPIIHASTPTTLLESSNTSVHSTAFSPDGTMLASAQSDGTVKLWTMADKTLARTFVHTPVKPWSNLTLKQVTAFNPAFPSAMTVAFSPDGGTVAVSNGDGTVSLWNVASGTESTLPYLDVQQELWNTSVTCLAFDPAGGLLASAYDSTNFRLWKLASRPTGRTQSTPGTNWVQSFAFSPDGSVLAVAKGDGNAGNTVTDGLLQLWEASSLTSLATLAQTNTPMQSLAYGSDGTTLASLRIDGAITLWDTSAHASLGTLADSGSGLTCIASGPRNLLAAGSEHDTVTLWDMPSRTVRIKLSTGTSTAIQCVAINPNGKSLVSGGATLTAWDIS